MHDARLNLSHFDKLSERLKPQLRSHVCINPVLGTAEAHKLFSLEYVPQNTVFDASFEIEAIHHAELGLLLSLLDTWDGKTGSAVGGSSGKGMGRLCWECLNIEVLTAEDLQTWLQPPDCQPLESAYKPLAQVPDYDALPARQDYQQYTLKLLPLGRFLVHDPYYQQKKEKTGDEHRDNDIPDLEYSRDSDGRALIPGSSLRGWLRGQMRRILITQRVEQLGVKAASEQAESQLTAVFGSTEQRGKLQISDCIATHDTSPYLQMFNAIDRFTGGVAEGKLYSANSVEAKALTGDLWVAKDLPEWAQHLLQLALRDAEEGDLRLGWGKARGYGQCLLQLHSADGKALQAKELCF